MKAPPAPAETLAPGLLFLVAAPSGAGKTSLVHGLLEELKDISLSVSHTTRPKRSNETDAADYYFVDVAEFTRMLEQGAFLEHAQVFGNYYGTSRAGVERVLQGGQDIVLEIDWQGAQQIRLSFPAAVSVFILPPSREALVQRLRQRGQDQAESIDRRTRAAVEELSHASEFDYLVVNDDFRLALSELISIVRAERCRQPRQSQNLGTLLQQLLQPSD